MPSTTTIVILGRALRNNIHAAPGKLAPVLEVTRSDGCEMGMGAVLHGPARIFYAARPEDRRCGSAVWIETVSAVTVSATPLLPPTRGGTHVHTNTHRERANRARLRNDATCMAFEPVLAVRSSKSATARLCTEIHTSGPTHLIYAAPGGPIVPMPCGAWVWALTYDNIHEIRHEIAEELAQ